MKRVLHETRLWANRILPLREWGCKQICKSRQKMLAALAVASGGGVDDPPIFRPAAFAVRSQSFHLPMATSDPVVRANNSSTRDTGQQITRFDMGRQFQELAPLTAQPWRLRKLISALGMSLGGISRRRNAPINRPFWIGWFGCWFGRSLAVS